MTGGPLGLGLLPDDVRHVPFMQRLARPAARVVLVSVHNVEQPLLLDVLQILGVGLFEGPLACDPHPFVHFGKPVGFGVVFLLSVQSLLGGHLLGPALVHAGGTHLEDAVFVDHLALSVRCLVEGGEAH